MVAGVIEMKKDTRSGVMDKVRFSFSERDENFLLLRHYNTFAFTQEWKAQIEQENPDTIVCLHDFSLSEIVSVFEPFLDFVASAFGKLSEDTIDKLLDACDVYSLHRSVLKSFLQSGMCVREENLLIDEVAFEQEKIATAVVNVISHLAGERQVVFLLNDIQYANGSTMHFIHNLLEDGICHNIIVFAAYNEAKVPLSHMKPLWDRFYRYVIDKGLVTETNAGELMEQKNGYNDFTFSVERLDDYIIQINNLIFFLDFMQANYYLEIIYKMITVEEISITWEYKCRIVRLYTLISIYTQNFSQALLLCEKLKELRAESNDLALDHAYFYFMCMAHMYNGRLEKAERYAHKCLDIAEKQASDYDIFIAKLLGIMVKMSGWHNIFFCANDIPIDQEVIRMAEKYHFWNHLAHIYVYAYDNHPALFADEEQIEDRLVHFNKGIELMRKLGNEYFMMEAYRNNVMIASTNGYFKTANYYYEKCHDLVKGKDDYEEAMIYNGVGYISSAMENYDKASECYNEALRRFLQMEKIDYVGETLYNMAINCIMAQDYKSAYEYLELCFRIVKEMKMNSLRVCNIAKLVGLLALCSHYNGNALKSAIYIEKTRLFLEHLTDKRNRKTENAIIHDYTTCKDDLFIYYFIYGLQLATQEHYKTALKNFELAAGCMEASAGNQFYIFGQYTIEFAKLYRFLGQEEDAQRQLLEAIDFYGHQGCYGKVGELSAALEGKQYTTEKRKLDLLPELRYAVDEVLRHASVYKENQEQQKRMNFLSAWQTMVEIGHKSRKELIYPAVYALIHNFNIDRLMLIKYTDNRAEELFNNTGYRYHEERRSRIEVFFHRNRLGFATSKINNNYTDYLDIISLFDKKEICSIIGLPFYYNNSLKAVMIAYITMKNSWHSPTNRYLLDESDSAVFEFLMRQLLNSVDMLEANDKIRCMNDKLNYLAVTDKLTGLFNREGFYGNIKNMLKSSHSGKVMQPITIMYIDLDNFKYYNDTFGHNIGDVILVEMADIFQEEVGNDGFVTRFGGDEFLITLYSQDNLRTEQLAKNIYRQIELGEGFAHVISGKLGKEVQIPKEHWISCSIGISSLRAVLSEDALEKVVKEADKVLYDVKKEGKGTYRFYPLSS